MAEIVISIAGKIAELLVVPIGKHICYPFKCQSNIEGLKKQVEKLTKQREMVQRSVDEAMRQGDEIEKVVETWLTSVDEFTQGVVKVISDDEDSAKKQCFAGLCPDLRTRYLVSKKAAKMAKDGVHLLGEGKFDKVSYRPPLQRTTSIYIKGYKDFASRMPIFEEMMQTLKDDSVNMIGVYGMGGVGKTTLVKRVVGQVIEDKLFDVVVMVDVTENPDIKNIQAQIADELGLKFYEESLSGRAARLRDRLKKEKKVLVVLDDIWAQLDLNVVGIPFSGEEEEKGSVTQEVQQDGRNVNKRQCKVLLTSRDLHVLRDDMNTQKDFLVNLLSLEEAGELFWKIVADSARKSDCDSMAVEIVQNCAGLPIAIATVANALKNKSLFEWKDALKQLENSSARNIEGMDAKVYSAIKFSYDALESEEAKSLFLLCSLYNKSANIYIDYFLGHCMGLGLFQNVSTIEQGRNRLRTLINKLRASCLLMEDNTNEYVKIHDIVRAVAMSIASTDKFMFNVQDMTDLKEMLEEKLSKDSTAISLPCTDVFVLPERLEYPKLKLFILGMKDTFLQIPDAFFEGMKELKVLDLRKFHMLSLPSSLHGLTNLQTLYLTESRLRDIAIIGALRKIEFLSFAASDIEQLPREISQLTRLRGLDLTHCAKLKVISPNVISSLTRLEELLMANSFVQWEVEGQSNVSLVELKQLSRLTTLSIHVLDAQIMPQDLLIFEMLERYHIFIGDVWEWSCNFEFSRMLKLKLNESRSFNNGIRILLNRAEDLYLDELKGVKNVVDDLDEEGFPQLQSLHVQNGCDIQYIINSIGWGLCTVFPELQFLFLHNLINLEKICHGQLSTVSFSKLRIINIRKCDRLKHLFTFSMAKNLLKLQEIEVTDCKELEEIIFKESKEQICQNEGIGEIKFTQLRKLTLQCLPQLTSFGFNVFKPYTESQEILADDEPGSSALPFSQNVELPNLENLELSSINIECKWLDQLPVMSSCCQTLKSLTLEDCSGSMKFLFSYSVVESLVLLEKLEIRNCKSIEGIINAEELTGAGKVIKMIVPKLISLQLKGLPNLTQFVSGNSIEFPSLIQLSIEDCPKLQKEVEEKNCQGDIQPLFHKKVVLPTLSSLNLSSVFIQTIWHNQLQPMSSSFQNLTKIVMDGCDNLKYVFSSSMVESLVKLKVLKISNCKLLEVVTITAGERVSNTLFPKLYELGLKHLPELTSFSKFIGNSIEFPSLGDLWLEQCPKMHTFVSNSPHGDMPANEEKQLNLEENLHSHIQPLFDEKVCIPDLEFFKMDKMENVRKIWYHQLALNSFSKLNYLGVFACHNLLNVFPYNMLRRLQKLEDLWVARCNSLEEIFEELKAPSCKGKEIVAKEETFSRFVFPQLTSLGIFDLPSLRIFYSRMYILEWPKLKNLRMWRCNKVEIPISEFLRIQEIHVDNQLENSIGEPLRNLDKFVLPKIEQLALEWNSIVKEMLHGKFSEYSSSLKFLELMKASKQSAICPCCFLYTLPNLERLGIFFGLFEEIFICEGHECKEKHVEAISKLSQLKLIALEDLSHLWEENSLPCKVFQNLTTLEVSGCHNLKNLVPRFVSFQNLTTLEVSKCNGLVNLMVVSVAKSLIQLTRLRITECKILEEIITHGVDEVKDGIVFNQLEYLELHNLPRLTSFYSGNCTIEFPSLQQVVVRWCPNMNIFSQGALITLRLHNLQITEAKEEGFWESGLNTTIQKMFKEMVGFRGIENFVVSDFPYVKEVWHKQFLANYFSNLKSLVVDDKCWSLRSIFTPSVALGLVLLKNLEIRNCAILEVIAVTEEETIKHNMFPNLNSLELKDLPELTSFCNFAGNAIDLPSLSTLWIEKCPNMETFISNSTGADLSAGKEILHTDIQPLFDEKVRLPNLTFLRLDQMDKLRKIWHHQLTLDSFNELNSLGINNCHNVLNIFPSNMLGRFQKLDELGLRNCSSLEVIFELQASSCGITKVITAAQLRRLVLNDLPKLRHIWDTGLQGLLTCQNLLSAQVLGCDSLESVFPASVGRNLLQLEELWIEKCCMVEEIFGKEQEIDEAVPKFPQLFRLRLAELPRLQSFYPRVHISEWPMLTKLQVWNCDKIEISVSNFLSFQVTNGENQLEMSRGHSLPLLDKIPFSNLESLGLDWKWIEKEALHEKLSEYSCKLKYLTFRGFHKEADICVYHFLKKLPNLEVLQVVEGLFKGLFLCKGPDCEEEHVEEPSKLSHLRLVDLLDPLYLWEENSLSSKVFQNLAILQAVCCNFKTLVPSSASFQNLKTLEVMECNELLNLMAVRTAKSLVLLTKLIISECKMVEEIITHDGDEAEEQIIFKKLRYLELVCLPSLTSFYSGNYTIEFPSLHQVVVRECSNMKTFSSGVLSTPKLFELQITEAEGKGFWKGNLNTSIEHLFIGQRKLRFRA